MEYIVNLNLICEVLSRLACKHAKCFYQSGEREELDACIFYSRIANGLCTEDNPNCHMRMIHLAIYLHRRFEQWGRMEDVEEAIRLLRVALNLCCEGHPDRPHCLQHLANALHVRFEQPGRPVDLEEAIEHYRAALKLLPKEHFGHSPCLTNLALTLVTRFEHCGQAEDLDEAILLHYTALEHCPNGHPCRSACLNYLAVSLQRRFDQLGRIEDLNMAVDLHRDALEACPRGQPACHSKLDALAASLTRRFQRYGHTEDLDEAIDIRCSILKMFPEQHPYRLSTLNNLANSLETRFSRCGQIEDLDEAGELRRTALKLCHRDHPHHSMFLNNLARFLQIRFEYHRRVEDFDEGIKLQRRALGLCPKGHFSRPIFLCNLAFALRIQFEVHEQMDVLNESIELYRSALELRPKRHPDWAKFLSSFSVSLLHRLNRQGQIEDLDEAIKLNRMALEHLPKDHPNRNMPLLELANSLKFRFQRYRQEEELQDAIELQRSALKLRPEGHTFRSKTLEDLAHSLFWRFNEFGYKDDFEESIQLLECSTEHKFSGLVARLDAAVRWISFARSQAHHTTSRAYKVAMLLLQRAVAVSPSLPAQLDFLKQIRHYRYLALEAVAFAIEEDRLEDAIEMLEQGRCLLWSQMHGFRTTLEELKETNIGLAEKFRNVSQRLENLTMSSTVPPTNLCAALNESPIADADKERNLFDEGLKLKRQLSDEQEEIINKIRLIPGFETFLAAAPFKTLQRAASEGPVIVVNHSGYRCDALIILARENLPVICVPLDGQFHSDSIKWYRELLVTRERFTADSSEYDKVLRQTMNFLWDRVVSKIINNLQEVGITEGSRIWWCPTSVLSALPFHAAGPFEDTDGTTKYLLDKYTSSYTPTLGVLIKARSDGNGGEPTVLVVGDTSLPSANREISNIRNCGISTKLLLKKATCDAVIKALRETTWVHFVCHGDLDPAPFGSSFKLSDRRLTLLDIVQAHLPNAEFAYLSACHTAGQYALEELDEVLHLAAAMQFSGFRSVIGSMWELLDDDGPLFARIVYEYMWDCDDGEARHKRAAEGLRRAAVELKAREDIRTERWVNLIHIGA